MEQLLQTVAAHRIVVLHTQILQRLNPAERSILVDEQRMLWDTHFQLCAYDEILRRVH